MSTEVKVPQLPESVADATLVTWHKKEGDAVERDENLVDIETDKVVLEVPAPAAGVLKSIKVEDGATVAGDQVIAILEEGATAEKADTGKTEQKESSGEKDQAEEDNDADSDSGEAKPLSPSVRRLVEEHKLDPAKIKGSGKNGRLTKADVQDYLDKGEEQPTEPTKPEKQAASSSSQPSKPSRGAREDRRVPMTRMRSRIAERMIESQTSTAMLTSFNEVDMSAVMALRKQFKDKFAKEHGTKLGFMSWFVKATVEALKKYPIVNASVEGNDIIYHDYYDIGVAVSTEKGLLVPVLRDADEMSFGDIENTLIDLAGRAREGKVSIDELTGGTFTITNGGVFGSLFSTPIINPPQSAILGMHAIKERAVAVDGEVVVRPMMYIAITYDHRIVDGKE
ncbi:MAG TPA: 2-oxoglutarate dehydrogenase complex dihydrolipoyllysine-residue succinyltransferase, partial [Gammaproteobacteria bacterium]|nr:2-oxoglutarate dehydrogenase complex dihydrolipoyllysine-residue succinyltransferase [Gammaproteobacteria bacterium]